MNDDSSDGQAEHGPAGRGLSKAHLLEVLARAEPDGLKRQAEALLPELGEIEVLSSRTGLALLPCADTVKGTVFHLGEVMMAEAHVRLVGAGVEGYGALVGRDVERAMGMAVIDAAIAASAAPRAVLAFVDAEARRQAAEDEERLRKVEATRVEMEAF